jgi:hypothetical protein
MTGENSHKETVPNSPEDKFLRDVRRASKKYSHKAKQARHQYVRVGLCTAAFSSLVPVAAGTSVPRWVVGVLGAVVVTGHGFFALTRPHERAIHYERAAKTLRFELLKYEYCSDPDKAKAREAFVARVVELRSILDQQKIKIDALGVPDTSSEIATGDTDGPEPTRTRGRSNDPSPALA